MESVGRYRLEEEVARGGMGAVWRAQAPDGREVALKLLHSGRHVGAHQRERFKKEVQALLRVRHPGVVAIEDAGEHQGAPWLCMEWVAGETLADRLNRRGWLPVGEALELVADLCLAVEACHAEGVLHRDLKPANVLLRARDGAPLLTDFGLARDISPVEDQGQLTRTGQWLGTPGYWAPEQALGQRDADGRATDVYGLGAILYAALTGRPPHEADSLQEHLRAVERAPERPSRHRPELPAWLDEVCLRALQPDPRRRFASAAALREALTWRAPAGAGGRTLLLPLLLGAVLVGGGGGAALALRAARPPAPGEGRPPGSRPAAPAPQAGASSPAPTPLGPQRAPTPAEREEAARLLARARELRDAGDLPATLEQLDAALRITPDDPDMLFGRAVTRESLGDLGGARRDVERAIELRPQDGRLRAMQATLLLDQGDLEAAVRAVDAAVAAVPSHAELHMVRGVVRARVFDQDSALQALTRALELDPTLVEAWLRRALVHADRGEVDGARSDMARAIELAPRDPRLWAVRASLRRQAGNLAGAAEDVQRAQELGPDFAEVWLQVGLLRAAQGEQAGALEALWRARELVPRDDPQLLAEVERNLRVVQAGSAR